MTTMDGDPVFLYTNMLVYANVEESPFHEAALSAIETRYTAGIDLWISRQVLREFLATLSRPQRFISPRPVSTLIERVRFFQGKFQIAEDSHQVTERLLALMEQIPTGGRQVHDANIVATMQTYGIRHLLTHNTEDFKRFSGLIAVLSIEASV